MVYYISPNQQPTRDDEDEDAGDCGAVQDVEDGCEGVGEAGDGDGGHDEGRATRLRCSIRGKQGGEEAACGPEAKDEESSAGEGFAAQGPEVFHC